MEGLLESVGAPVQDTCHRWIGDRSVEAMEGALGDVALQQALAEGRGMSAIASHPVPPGEPGSVRLKRGLTLV